MPVAKFATLDEFARELDEMGGHSPEYWDKQVHKVPMSRTVDRIKYLEKYATGKTILHIGCTGYLDQVLRKAATKCYGVDASALDRPDFVQCNLDESPVPLCEGVELIICGEVLEHLSNPGRFLVSMRQVYPDIPVIFTVPNAFTAAGADWLVKRGRENVNKDHVCYYSYTTVNTLLNRAGYRLNANYWYGGKPYTAEGLIVVALPRKD